jgi:predicted negative regulator of RcsB-dependent stress response
MSEFETDDEQLAALKLWWKENAIAVLTGVVLGIGLLAGWFFWQQYKHRHAEEASAQYTHLMINLQANSLDTIPATTDLLFNDYADTPYAALAGLGAAKVAVENHQESAAAERLQWVIDNAKQQHLKLIARLRLAELQVSQAQIEAAEKTLDAKYPAAYQGLLETLKGDIAFAKGDKEAAIKHYQTALNTKDVAVDKALLEMKLDELGAATQPADVIAPVPTPVSALEEKTDAPNA